MSEKRAWIAEASKHAGSGCLVWPWARNNWGRGVVSVDGKVVLVSREVCAIRNGPAPSDKPYAAHRCGNGHEGCASGAHLYWASAKENSSDTVKHGTRLRGEACHSAKLTEADVVAIRSARGLQPQVDLALAYGVGPDQISRIQTGKRWKHMEKST